MKPTAFFALAAATLIAVSAVKAQIRFPDGTEQATAAVAAVPDVQARQIAVAAPPPGSTATLFDVQGAGSFLNVQITQQGGIEDFLTVRVVVDGQEIENRSFDRLVRGGLTQPNPTGTVALLGEDESLRTIAVGFPYPIAFERRLLVQAQTGITNTGIQFITGRLLFTR